MKNIICAVVVLAISAAADHEYGQLMKWTVVNPLVRVPLTGAVTGADTAELFAARGETESFQIVCQTPEESFTGPAGESWALVNKETGAAIHADNVVLYHEVFVPVTNPSPGSDAQPGPYADALVPLATRMDPLPWKNGSIETVPGQNTVLWVDVRVPPDAAPGVYEGNLTFNYAAPKARTGRVSGRYETGTVMASLPVRLTVWNFTLPPGPSHENHFGGFGYAANYLKTDPKSPEVISIEDKYIEMMAAHRLNPPIPARLKPAIADDGTPQFSDELTAHWVNFVKRYNVTNIEVPRAPFADSLGADRQKALNFYRGWYAFLDKNGWAAGAYHYMLDEPNDAEAYEQVRKLGALVKDAEPRLRRLVVEQPYTQDPAWPSIDEAIDIWCPLFGFIDDGAVRTVLAKGDHVWSYTALCQIAPPYHPNYEAVKDWKPPFWQIDFPPASYRIATWVNRRYNITGLLYWSTVYWGDPERNPWENPAFRGRFNGEGALFYPGNQVGIDGPVASIRLKNLRDGMEDYEYFRLLEAKSGADAVLAVIKQAVPDWGHVNYDPDTIIGLRNKTGQALAS